MDNAVMLEEMAPETKRINVSCKVYVLILSILCSFFIPISLYTSVLSFGLDIISAIIVFIICGAVSVSLIAGFVFAIITVSKKGYVYTFGSLSVMLNVLSVLVYVVFMLVMSIATGYTIFISFLGASIGTIFNTLLFTFIYSCIVGGYIVRTQNNVKNI